MFDISTQNTINNIFKKNRKCIINTDLDGILSGMILQHYLNWKVVGYSSCCGKHDDELWISSEIKDFNDCVFVDLPVCIDTISVIDQHFVATDMDMVKSYKKNENKLNPNILRQKIFLDSSKQQHYTEKYPFGTVHFVIAILEMMNIIKEDEKINFDKVLGGIFNTFDLADLILRADRVIGNTCYYTDNCFNWSDWLMSFGGNNTKELFKKVKNEYSNRKFREKNVEQQLLELGCKGKDGECSNMFRNKNYDLLEKYMNYLSNAIELRPLPMFQMKDYRKLKGKRICINKYKFNLAKNELKDNRLFSFAFVSMKELSVTYYIEEDKL